MDESKKWAVVTGASSGLGEVFAKELAKRGYSVLAIARRKDRLARLAKEAEGHVEPLAADLETDEGVSRVLQRAAELEGLDLLVNNAGFGISGHYLETQAAREAASIRLNVNALVALTRGVLPTFVAKGKGGVINVASTIAFQPVPYFTTYAATKAFVLHYSEGVAHELKDTGVRVLAVCPGPVKTEFESISGNSKFQHSIPNLTPERVVHAALKAYEKGKIVEVVGGVNRLLVFFNSIAPRGFVRGNMARFALPEGKPA